MRSMKAEMHKEIARVDLVFVLLCVVGLVGAFVYQLTFPPKGIIAWEGYEHAVALCTDQYKGEITVGDVTLYQGKNYMMTINKGHENDKEVRHLKVLALTECDKLFR